MICQTWQGTLKNSMCFMALDHSSGVWCKDELWKINTQSVHYLLFFEYYPKICFNNNIHWQMRTVHKLSFCSSSSLHSHCCSDKQQFTIYYQSVCWSKVLSTYLAHSCTAYILCWPSPQKTCGYGEHMPIKFPLALHNAALGLSNQLPVEVK